MKIVPLCTFVLSTLAGFSATAATLEITNEVAHPLPERMFGQFLERPSWGGETGPEGVVAEDGRLPATVVEALAGLHATVVRFPFGTDGDYVDWRDMADLPERSARPVTVGNRGNEVSNRFGFPEYFDLAGKMGWSTILVTNLRDALYGKKPVADAAAHAAALLRYARGLPAGNRIIAMQVGNEAWAFWPPRKKFAEQFGELTTTEMADRLRAALVAYADAIHAVDPEMKLIADCPKLDDGGGLADGSGVVWREAIDHDDIRSRYAWLAAHAYSPLQYNIVARGDEKLDPKKLSDDEIWYGLVATPGRFDAAGEAVADRATYVANLAMGFRTAETEWNWNEIDFRKKFPESRIDLRAPAALGAAQFLQGLMRSPDVELATQSMMLGTAWGIASVRVGEDGDVRYQPQGEAFRLHAEFHGDRVMVSRTADVATVDSPVRFAPWWPQVGKLAMLDAVVTADDAAWYVHWIHRERAESAELTIQLPTDARAAGTAVDHRLAGEAMARTKREIAWDDHRLQVSLPPASLGVFVIPR